LKGKWGGYRGENIATALTRSRGDSSDRSSVRLCSATELIAVGTWEFSSRQVQSTPFYMTHRCVRRPAVSIIVTVFY